MLFKTKKSILVVFLSIMMLSIFVAGCADKPETDAMQITEKSDDWSPSRIEVIIPTVAGGGNDAIGRALVGVMGDALGANASYNNISGASNRLGVEAFMQSRQAPEGEVLLFGNMATMAFMYSLQKEELSFKWDDIDWLGTMVVDPLVLAVQNDGPFATIEDFINEGKKRDVSLGIAQWAMTDTVGLLQLEEQTGASFEIIPMDGSTNAVASILGGHLDAVALKATQAKVDGLKTIGIFQDENLIPEITNNAPTVNDALGLDVMEVASYRSLGVHADFKANYPDRYEKVLNIYKESIKNDEFKQIVKDRDGVPDALIVDWSPEQVNATSKKIVELVEKYRELFN